jgi:hypothetical protein
MQRKQALSHALTAQVTAIRPRHGPRTVEAGSRRRFVVQASDSMSGRCVVRLKLRAVTLNIEPVGRAFRDSAERMAYLRQAGKQADYEEAMLRWESKNREYKACQASGASGCIGPGSPP